MHQEHHHVNDDNTQHPLRILALIGIVGTMLVMSIMLIQVFTEGLLG